MKITIAYLEAEAKDAEAIAEGITKHYPISKVRKSDRHPPFKHIYLTTKKPKNPCRSK